MKTAIICDWLVTYAGSEKVLEEIIRAFPDSDLFAVVDFLPEKDRAFLLGKKVKTSFIQKFPFARTKYRSYLPLMPLAVEQFDLSSYDLILSSSHAVAKGVITGPNQFHICYCHSPIRYAWDLQHQYLKESGLEVGFKSWLAKYVLFKIRNWDFRTSNGVNEFIANSEFIRRRIFKVYRRDATVIYPPVDIDGFPLMLEKSDYYLTASRMVPYKRIDVIVDAFSMMPEKKLVVIGDGPDFKKIKANAGSNVIFLGYQDSLILRSYMQKAKAFIFMAEEDFGIVPVEAQACGTPVIAYGKGGSLETIRGVWVDELCLSSNNPTGVYIREQNVDSLKCGIDFFEKNINNFRPEECRKNAVRFCVSNFVKEFTKFISEKYTEWFLLIR